MRAYDRVSAEYEHGRPTYAPAAIDHVVAALGLQAGDAVLDLGAGTGKLTRLLVAAGLDAIALDPNEAMLARVPGARTLVGRAEAIPLADGSVAAVTAAQAFHWFETGPALAEIRRVLVPGGGLALVWNKRDDSDPVQQLLAELTDPPERGTPRGWQLDVPTLIDGSGLFGPVEQAEFPHAQTTDEAGLLSRLRSSSYVAALPAERRAELEGRLVGIGGPVQLRHTTLVYVARRRA